MSKTLNTIIAIALVGIFPALSIYAGTQGDGYTQENAVLIATQFLKGSPTYSFDGIEGSMKVEEVVIAESYPIQYFITISFDCSHAGYGDRTGEILAQVITSHKVRLTVVSEEVQGAVIDGEWDEINEREKVVSELLPPEAAVQIVVEYLKENYPAADELEITDEWSIANLTPEGLVGASTLEYSGDGWVIRVSYPVVWNPTYNFEVEHPESEFTWSGTVDQSGAVTE